MVYRSATLRSTGYSLSEIMLNRQIRTTLPILPLNIEPSDYGKEKVKNKRQANQRRNEFYYNRKHSSKPLSVLKEGDQVRIKTEKDDEWSNPAVVIGNADTPRSYRVQTDR